MRRLARRSCLAAGALMAFAATPASAEAWPSQHVRFVLPFGAGSATDTSARLLQNPLTLRWKQPVVIENKPGGDGLIAVNAFLSAADPHVLLFASTVSLVAHPYQQAKLPYELKRDLEPIAMIANTVLGVAVPASLNIDSLRDFVAQVRARPGEMNFTGAPGLPALALDSFISSEKLDAVVVPYRDVVRAASDLGEDRLQLLITSYAILKPHVETGKVKILAVTSRERSESAPDTPTVLEEGFGALEMTPLTGLFGPRGMPRDLRDRIARDVADALSDPTVASRIAVTGQNVRPGGPAEFAQALDAQVARAAEVANVLGIKSAERPTEP